MEKNSKLQKWLAHKKSSSKARDYIVRAPENQPINLSFGQLRIWLLQQLNPGNPFYHYVEAYKITGRLREEDFIQSLKDVVSKHGILRTTIYQKDGIPVQQENATLEPELSVHDLSLADEEGKQSELVKINSSLFNRPFNLEEGPLIRLGLVKLEDDNYSMVLALHHIVTDQWSMNTLREEWAQRYRDGIIASELPCQYADFAFNQKSETIDEKHLNYWTQKLAGDIPRLELPTNRERKNQPSYRGALSEQKLSPFHHEQLQALSKKSNVTMFMLLLSLFKVLLYRYSRQSDILVATPVSNRDQTYLERVVGFFNETVILRTEWSDDLNFLQLLKNVRKTVLDAFSHKNIPFDSLVQRLKPERMVSSNPLFRVMFLYNEDQDMPSLGKGIDWEYSTVDIGVSKFDLTLYISEGKDNLSVIFEYATDIFDQETIDRMHGHFQTLIDGVLKEPTQAIAKLPLLTDAEEIVLTKEWNSPVRHRTESETVLQLIKASIAKYPNQPAVVFQNFTLTYAELNQRADEIAHKLLNNDIGSGSFVGIATDRSPEMAIAVLAVLKTGAAYVPLDPKYPRSRLEYMIEDAGISVIITQPHHTDIPSSNQVSSILVEADSEISANQYFIDFPDTNVQDIAYLIYTSGSSGLPKGVLISHQNLASSTNARISYYPQPPGKFLLLSSFSFDSSVAGIYWTLCCGGTLVLPQDRLEQDMNEMAEFISEQQVTHTLLLPSLYNLLLTQNAKKLSSLNTVILAGETCTTDVCLQHIEKLPNAALFNEYGPTEGTVWSTVCEITTKLLTNSVPIGHPIDNTKALILDDHHQLVPVGIVGELYIGGPGVSPGYLNNQELTQEKFITYPHGNEGTERIYKTGDLARYRPDGNIEFLGRADNQVKVRGYRIEPGEIQAVINTYPGVKESAIVLGQNHAAKTLETDQIVALLQEMPSKHAEYLINEIESSAIQGHSHNQ